MKRGIFLLLAAIMALLGISNIVMSILTGYLLYLIIPISALNLIAACVFVVQAVHSKPGTQTRPAKADPPGQDSALEPAGAPPAAHAPDLPAPPPLGEAVAAPEAERDLPETPPLPDGIRWSGKYRYILEGVKINACGAPQAPGISPHRPLDLLADPAGAHPVRVMQGNTLLGYLRRGRIHDLVEEYLRKNLGIYATVAAYSGEENALAIDLKFLHPQKTTQSFLLSDGGRGRSRDPVSPESEGQAVHIEYDGVREKYRALDESGRLLGYLPFYADQYMPRDESRLPEVEAVVDSVVSISKHKNVVQIAVKI